MGIERGSLRSDHLNVSASVVADPYGFSAPFSRCTCCVGNVGLSRYHLHSACNTKRGFLHMSRAFGRSCPCAGDVMKDHAAPNQFVPISPDALTDSLSLKKNRYRKELSFVFLMSS
jgi:hypothetical protein